MGHIGKEGALGAVVACVLGAVFMAILLTISEKKNIKWLKEWNLTISILAAMIITAVI